MFSLRRRRRLFVASAALAGAVLITSCGEDPPATVDSFAQSLARALSSGDFSQVSFSSGSAETLSQAAENLHEPFGELTPEVTVAQIDVLEPPEDSPRAPTAEITYEHRWDLGELGISGEEWTYTTTAEFSYDAEADVWHAEATAETLLPDYAGHEGIGLVTTSAERGRIMDDNGNAINKIPTPYKGLYFQGSQYANTLDLGLDLPGLFPHSATREAYSNARTTLTTGSAEFTTVYQNSQVDSFDLYELYYGCTLGTLNGIASLPKPNSPGNARARDEDVRCCHS